MELPRTVLVKLDIDDEQAVLLDETIDQFLWSTNFVVDRARQEDGYVLTESGNRHERMPGAKRLDAWTFRQLHAFVEYKAEAQGIQVEQVAPAKTSQRCLTCGHTDPRNRPTQIRFCCQRCGYENHTEYNAAKNIAFELLQNQNGAKGAREWRVTRGLANHATGGAVSRRRDNDREWRVQYPPNRG